ncbi:MAG: ABC transporter permease subunit [Geminicoccaceae bacterium]
MTLLLGAASIVLGMAGGLLLALARLYARSPLRQLAIVYIDVFHFRAIPLLFLHRSSSMRAAFVGIRLSPFLSAVTALSLVSSAYLTEIFRAGIEAVPQGYSRRRARSAFGPGPPCGR